MCILELSKVLMCECYYDYFNINYGNNSRRLFAYTDSLMYESNTEDAYEHFSNNKEVFVHLTKPKYRDNSNKLVVGKLKMHQVMLYLKNLLD